MHSQLWWQNHVAVSTSQLFWIGVEPAKGKWLHIIEPKTKNTYRANDLNVQVSIKMHSHMLRKQTNYCTACNQRDTLEITKMNQKYLLFSWWFQSLVQDRCFKVSVGGEGERRGIVVVKHKQRARPPES